MTRKNKGLTVKEELELTLESDDEKIIVDLGFSVSSPDGNGTVRAFSWQDDYFDDYIGQQSSLYDSQKYKL